MMQDRGMTVVPDFMANAAAVREAVPARGASPSTGLWRWRRTGFVRRWAGATSCVETWSR